MNRIFLTTVLTCSLMTTLASAQDFSNVKSGLLLGIYAIPSQGGMRVTGIIPGYSAQGRLFPGDVLLRTTIDGLTMYRLRTHYEMENAKMAIGANQQAAVEFWRPSVGLMYAWVEFTPIYGPAAAPGQAYSIENPAKAEFKLESEKPGAREMFQKGGPGGAVTPGLPGAPSPGPQPGPGPAVPPGGNPGDLFNR